MAFRIFNAVAVILAIHIILNLQTYLINIFKLIGTLEVFGVASRIVYPICTLLYPSQICGGMLANYAPYAYVNIFKYLSTTNLEHSSITIPPAKAYVTPLNNNNIVPFIVLNDLHSDLKYVTNSTAECKDILCCREVIPGIVSNASKYGQKGKCGLPMSAFNALSSNLTNETIFLLGDFPPHDAWERTLANTFDEAIEITTQLKLRWSSLYQLYPVLGNHEGYPVDHLDPSNSSYILSVYANLWRHWLTGEAYETFKEYGYYSMRHSNTSIVIIALNSLYYEIMNTYIWSNRTILYTQLEWLTNQLLYCENNGYSAIIIGHIPLAHYYTLPEFYENYVRIVERFNNTIRAQFFGHTHVDHFQMMKHNNSNVGVAFISPPMTTFKCQPSYRRYIFDGNTNLMDYNQYKSNLTTDPPYWVLDYSFKSNYNISEGAVLNAATISDLTQKAFKDASLLKKLVFRLVKGEHNVSVWEEKYLACMHLNCSHPYDFFNCASYNLNIRTIVTSMVSDMLELK